MALLTITFYSVLSASTGSFFAASFAGISPAITVNTTLIPIRISPPTTGSDEIFDTPVIDFIIMFAGIQISIVIPIPIIPASKSYN